MYEIRYYIRHANIYYFRNLTIAGDSYNVPKTDSFTLCVKKMYNIRNFIREYEKKIILIQSNLLNF